MAYLVLKDERTYADEWDNEEKFYEFDPADKDSVDRIHQILSLRKFGVIKNSETVLAGICEKTITPAPSVKAKTFAERLIEQAGRFLNSPSSSKRIFFRKQSPAIPAYPCKCLSTQSTLQ